MAYKEKEIEKIYFTIGEVAKMMEVKPSLIRHWESEFPQIKPRKDRNGNRVFTKNDIEILKNVHHLLRQKGFTIEGAKHSLKEYTSEKKNQTQILEKLQKIKLLLEKLKG